MNIADKIRADSYRAPVTVVVTSPSCVPCASLKPKLRSLAEEKNFNLVELDGLENKEFCREHMIRSVPTVMIFNKGTVVASFSGDRSRDDLLAAISRAGGLQGSLL